MQLTFYIEYNVIVSRSSRYKSLWWHNLQNRRINFKFGLNWSELQIYSILATYLEYANTANLFYTFFQIALKINEFWLSWVEYRTKAYLLFVLRYCQYFLNGILLRSDVTRFHKAKYWINIKMKISIDNDLDFDSYSHYLSPKVLQ